MHKPFVILAHSSRSVRGSVDLELYVRDLVKRGIRLVSIIQETNDDPIGDMMRKMIAIFDEHSSKENAKHTLRAMKENARQNFWNESDPPHGVPFNPRDRNPISEHTLVTSASQPLRAKFLRPRLTIFDL
jgi:DNA invertase Pin-like site-specific DNA recombinase